MAWAVCALRHPIALIPGLDHRFTRTRSPVDLARERIVGTKAAL